MLSVAATAGRDGRVGTEHLCTNRKQAVCTIGTQLRLHQLGHCPPPPDKVTTMTISLAPCDAFRFSPSTIANSGAEHHLHEIISPGRGINLPTPEVASKDAASEAAARRLQQRINRLSAEISCQIQHSSDVSNKASPQLALEPAATSFKRWSDPKELVTRRVRARLTAAEPQEPLRFQQFDLLVAEASPAACRGETLPPVSPRCTLTPLPGRLPTPGVRSELEGLADFEAAPRYRFDDSARACVSA